MHQFTVSLYSQPQKTVVSDVVDMKRQVYSHARKNSKVHGRYFREKDISVVGHEDIRLHNLYMYEYVAAET